MFYFFLLHPRSFVLLPAFYMRSVLICLTLFRVFRFVFISSVPFVLFCFTSFCCVHSLLFYFLLLHALHFDLLKSFSFNSFFCLVVFLASSLVLRPSFPPVSFCLPSFFAAPFLLFCSLLFVHTVLLYSFPFRGCCYVPIVLFFPPPITTTGLNGLKHCCRSVGNHLDTAQPFRCAFRSAGHVTSLPFPFIDLFTPYWFAFTATLDHGNSFILPTLEFYNFGNGEMVFKINFMMACGLHKNPVDSLRLPA